MCHDSAVSTSQRRLLSLGLASAVCGTVLAACAGGSGDSTGSGGGEVVTEVSDIRVINPAMVAVDFTAENQGNSALTLECAVAVIDPDGTSEGSKSVTVPDVAPGSVQQASVQVEVSDEGAEFVTQASVECTGA